MFESLRRWNKERKLDPHERFILQAERRIAENARRERAGLKPKGMVIRSAESVRYSFGGQDLPKKQTKQVLRLSGIDPSATLVPSAEWQGIDYSDFTEEELVAQCEPPLPRAKQHENHPD